MAEKKPNIRFKGFEEEWEDKPFADAYKSAAEGGTPSTSVKDYYVGGSIPFVKIEDTEQKYIHDTASHITEKGMNNSSAWLIPSNSIIFTNGATIGNVAINKVPVTTKQGILGVIQDTSKFELEYLYYALLTDEFQTEVEKRQSKGTFATIILRNLDKIDIPHTSLPEQRKIGEFFKQLDELIGAKEQELEKLRQIKLALLDKMFPSDNQENINGGGKSLIYKMLKSNSQLVVSSPAPNTPTIRFRGFTEPWGKKRIEEIVRCPLDYGLNAASTKYDGKRKYLRITDIDDSMRTFNYSDLTSPNLNNISDNYKLQNGDIVFARTGASVGKTYLYDKCDGEVYFAGFLIRARIKDMYSPYFVFTSTLTDDFSKFIKITSQRTGQPGVNAQEYESYSLYIPGSYDEQCKIGDFFRSQDEAIANSQLQINKLKTIKQACLSQMFA